MIEWYCGLIGLRVKPNLATTQTWNPNIPWPIKIIWRHSRQFWCFVYWWICRIFWKMSCARCVLRNTLSTRCTCMPKNGQHSNSVKISYSARRTIGLHLGQKIAFVGNDFGTITDGCWMHQCSACVDTEHKCVATTLFDCQWRAAIMSFGRNRWRITHAMSGQRTWSVYGGVQRA